MPDPCRPKPPSSVSTPQVLSAKRGAIIDRNGRPIAYTDEARSLTFLPKAVRKSIADTREGRVGSRCRHASGRDRQGVSSALGGSISATDLLAKLNSPNTFEYLARSVSPEVSARITEEFPEVGADPQPIRLYPGGSLAANIVGDVDYDGQGLLGLEASLEPVLGGTDGSRTYDRGSDGR